MSYVYRDCRTKARPWYIAFKGVDGKLRKEKTEAPTKELARMLLARKIVEVTEAKVAGVKIERKPITLHEFLKEYRTHVEASHTPPSVDRELRSMKQIERVFGGVRLKDITSGLVQKYVDELSTAEIAARAGKNEKAAESTLHRARAAFGRVFTLLAKKRGGYA